MTQILLGAEDAARALALLHSTTQPRKETPAEITARLAAQIEGLREQANAAARAAQEAQEAVAEAQHQVQAAQAAQQQRQHALAEHEERADQLAQQHLAAGQGEASAKERAEDAAAQRLRRELARGETALGVLAAKAAEAQNALQLAQNQHTRAQVALERAVLSQASQELTERVADLLAQLLEVAAEGRQHNKKVIQLVTTERQMTGQHQVAHLGSEEAFARAAGNNLLFLPGQLPGTRADRQALADRGFIIQFALDLVTAEADEWTGRGRMAG